MKKTWQLLGLKSVEALKNGVDTVANIVKITLGAKGMSVVAEREYAEPIITNDGVTIAKGIEVDDPFENQGVLLVKEAADKTNTDTGDGTTTVTLLCQAILEEGIKNLAAGASRKGILSGIEMATETIVKELKKNSKKIASTKEKLQVATISSGSAEWGKDIVTAIEKVGVDGVVTVEEGGKSVTEIDYIKGFQFDNGLISPFFITERMRAEAILKDPYIVMIDRDIVDFLEILPIVEKIKAKGKPFLLIADSVEGHALSMLILNRVKTGLQCAAVKAPAVGVRRRVTVQDIAVLTGGKVLSKDIGIEIKDVALTDLGQCEKIIINKDYTTILGGKADKQAVQGRINELKEQMESAESDFDKGKLQDRLARLTGGVAQIMVGADTETEMKAKHYKYEDALNATKAALQEGIVAGGGIAYLDCLSALDNLTGSKEELLGIDIIREAIKRPTMQICDNAGLKGELIMLTCLKKGRGIGYDVSTDKYCNMVRSGIIDPVKVSRLALQNAVSVSKKILETGGVIVNIPDTAEDRTNPKPKQPGRGSY